MNNSGVALLRSIGSSSRVGVALGQESFLQEYDGIEEGMQVGYRQNYVALWGGLFYEHSLLTTDLMGVKTEMFGRLLAGACATGPLGKLMIGVRYWLVDRFMVIGGAEGTTLRYRYQQKWFHTDKLGATVGVAMRF
jgi:hypothetical protein